MKILNLTRQFSDNKPVLQTMDSYRCSTCDRKNY